MSKWSHMICENCWVERNPEREPVRIKEEFRAEGPCCYCKATQKSGIYVRDNPAETPCKGEGLVHEEEL
jgi:hypothetical protein